MFSDFVKIVISLVIVRTFAAQIIITFI